MVRKRTPSIPRPIRLWTARKLEYLDAYLQAYVQATKSLGQRYYIDAFAGCGDCILEDTGRTIAGSPWRALAAVPKFTKFFFVEKHRESTEYLQSRVGQRADVTVLCGDCNVVIPSRVLPNTPRAAPSFAFLDPTGLQLKWDTIEALAAHRLGPYKMELLILFPYDMAIAMNLHNRGAQRALTMFYGHDRWLGEYDKSLALHESPVQRRERFTELYILGLKGLGYRYVEKYGPLKDGNRGKYHVVFASDNATGAKIMHEVWSKPRAAPGDMFYTPLRRPKK